MQSSAQEVTMLFKLIAAANDSWACLVKWALNLKLAELATISPSFIQSGSSFDMLGASDSIIIHLINSP